MNKSTVVLFALVITLVGVGCSASKPPENPFKTDRDTFLEEVHTIALAPLNISVKVDDMEKVKAEFEQLIEKKLNEAGYKIISSKKFADTRKRLIEETGGYYDPISGERDENKYVAIKKKTREELSSKYGADAILYPHIIVVKVPFKDGGGILDMPVEWDGAKEKIDMRSGVVKFLSNSTISGNINALSLWVAITDTDNVTLYKKQGGIQVLSKFDRGLVSVPKNELLTKSERNEGAVNIALEPLVRKADY